jgi:hypothetical protein
MPGLVSKSSFPISTAQLAQLTGVSHHAQPEVVFLIDIFMGDKVMFRYMCTLYNVQICHLKLLPFLYNKNIKVLFLGIL